MNITKTYQVDPVVRTNLDFKLDDIPRFWFDNDPFLTRIFDALSVTFPDGERYFIQSVRLFRDQITDPILLNKVNDFIRQEAQHGIAHDKMNAIMRAQGMPIDRFINTLKYLFDLSLKKASPEYNIAATAASEHLTALMAETFFGHKETLAKVHPYVRALFAWHAIEEMEHRDVAFDVMRNVANVSESLKNWALILNSILMATFTLYRVNVMLTHDGFNRRARLKLFAKGLPWLFGRQGTLMRMRSQYLDWFKKDFHPSQHPVIEQYAVWIETLEKTGDPIQAGQAFWEAAKTAA